MSQAIMIETFPVQERGMAMSIFGIGAMFGPVVGPALGGWITDNLDWRWIFYINIPVGIIVFLVISIVSLLLLLYVEMKHEHPVINLRLFRTASFSTGNFIMFMVGFCL